MTRLSTARQKANQEGSITERLVDISLHQYVVQGRLAWSPTYPEFIALSRNKRGEVSRGFFKEQGTPDRDITFENNRAGWLEIKTWTRKDRYTLSERLHQYEKMRADWQAVGRLGFYLVKWKWDGAEDWRLYPVWALDLDQGRLVFERENGLEVPDGLGYPDWLDLALVSAAAMAHLERDYA